MLETRLRLIQKLSTGRHGLAQYQELGYHPQIIMKVLLWILDYALYFVFYLQISQEDLAQTYAQYAKNYQNSFDSEIGYMRGAWW